MPASEYSELQEIVERAFTEELGSAASADELLQVIAADLPEHLDHYIRAAGIKTAIGTYFRRKRADGLPQAPEVNAEGVHKQLDLLDVPEFRYVIGKQMKSSAAARSQAEKLAHLCRELHGVVIPLELVEDIS